MLAAPALVLGAHVDQRGDRFQHGALARSPFQSDRRVIDVSGDGTNNSGRDVTAARDEAIAKGVTINGLVILSEVPLPTNPSHTHPPGGLTAYYENNVIGGPGAFVLEAENFEAFGQLIISKLIKEIAELGAPPCENGVKAGPPDRACPWIETAFLAAGTARRPFHSACSRAMYS